MGGIGSTDDEGGSTEAQLQRSITDSNSSTLLNGGSDGLTIIRNPHSWNSPFGA
jgi:hypothetical protein